MTDVDGFIWQMIIPILLTALLFLNGCGGSGVILPLDMAPEVGETARNFNTVVADASTAKEISKFRTQQVQAQEYTKAYLQSGFTMTYQKIALADGTVTYLPLVNFRQPPVKPIPAEVSEHPVWKVTNNILGTVARWGFGYLAVDTIVGSYEAISDNAGDKFYGDAQIAGSYNTAGGDQSVEVGRQQQDNSYRQDSEGCTNGDCNGGSPEEEEGEPDPEGGCGPGSFEDGQGTWWTDTPGCSCHSRSLGHC